MEAFLIITGCRIKKNIYFFEYFSLITSRYAILELNVIDAIIFVNIYFKVFLRGIALWEIIDAIFVSVAILQ